MDVRLSDGGTIEAAVARPRSLRRRLRNFLATAAFYLIGGLSSVPFTLIICPPLFLFGWLSKGASRLGPRIATWYMQLYAKLLDLLGIMRIEEVESEVPIEEHGAAVYVVNHRSMLDAMVLFALIEDSSALVKSWGKPKQDQDRRTPMPPWWAPFIAAPFRLAGYISMPADFSDPRALLQTSDACVEMLQSGRSIVIFPEGTRSRDGRLLPFRDFPFKVALSAGVPVVPVALHVDQAFFPKGTFTVHAAERARFRLKFFEPLRPGRGLRARDLSRHAHRLIGKALASLDERYGYRLD